MHTGPVPNRRGRRGGRWSLSRQLLALQGVLVVTVVAIAVALAYRDTQRDVTQTALERTAAVARSVADSADVADAVAGTDPTASLQPYAEQVRTDTGTDFVVVMAPDGTRWTHPDPDQIGRTYIGTTAPALAGEVLSETYTGTLGPSVRTVAPVRADDGEVVALVSVGITIDQVSEQMRTQLPTLALGAAAVLVVAAAGSWLLAGRVRRQTFGLGPAELAQMYGYYDAVLHSVREGLLLLDADGRLELANAEAERLLDLPDDARGRRVADLGLPGDLVAALTRDGVVTDELHVARDRVVAVSVAAVGEDDARTGRVVTLRDHTDLQRLSGELDTTRGLTDALRSAQHEAANRLHTVVALVELGRHQEAIELAVGELAAVQSLADAVVASVDEPVVAALLLGKSAVAAERGIELVVQDGTRVDEDAVAASGLPPRDLVTVLGNLVDNAVEALAGARTEGLLTGGHERPPQVRVLVRQDGGDLLVRVSDDGPGLDEQDARRAFERGWSTKPAGGRAHGRGLGLALVGQVVHRAGGSVEVTAGPGGGAAFTVRLPLHQRVRP